MYTILMNNNSTEIIIYEVMKLLKHRTRNDIHDWAIAVANPGGGARGPAPPLEMLKV